MSLTIDIRADALQKRLAGVSGRLVGRAMQEALAPLGAQYEAALIAETPVGKGPAQGRRRLYQNYQRRATAGDNLAQVAITNTTPHLQYVLRGRGPVVAKPGKVLRFEILGQVIFARRVRGVKPSNFPKRAARAMRPQVRAAARDVARAIVGLV